MYKTDQAANMFPLTMQSWPPVMNPPLFLQPRVNEMGMPEPLPVPQDMWVFPPPPPFPFIPQRELATESPTETSTQTTVSICCRFG
jgi:hypothetical protein